MWPAPVNITNAATELREVHTRRTARTVGFIWTDAWFPIVGCFTQSTHCAPRFPRLQGKRPTTTGNCAREASRRWVRKSELSEDVKPARWNWTWLAKLTVLFIDKMHQYKPFGESFALFIRQRHFSSVGSSNRRFSRRDRIVYVSLVFSCGYISKDILQQHLSCVIPLGCQGNRGRPCNWNVHNTASISPFRIFARYKKNMIGICFFFSSHSIEQHTTPYMFLALTNS